MTKTFSSRPFPGSRHRQLRWTNSRGCVAMMFSRGALGCLALKKGTSCICQCALLPEKPCEANRTCHTWDQACAPDLNDLPHHGIPWEQPLSLCGWQNQLKEGLLIFPDLACLYRTPCLSNKWVITFPQELSIFGWVSWFRPLLPQGSIFKSSDDQTE